MTAFSRNILHTSSQNSFYYFGISRKLNVIHCQLRMKCSDLKGHLFNMHVIEDASCICSDLIEDCEHFFFSCQLYNEQRQKLYRELYELFPDIAVNLQLLLFGNENLLVNENNLLALLVQTFIRDSGRFEM